jgi:hypothetical protein
MFKKALLISYQKNKKWYFGSFTGFVGTVYFFNKYLNYIFPVALAMSGGLLLASWAVIGVIEFTNLLKEDNKNKDIEINTANTRIRELEEVVVSKNLDIVKYENDILSIRDEKSKLLLDSSYAFAIITLTDAFSKIHSLRKAKKANLNACLSVLKYVCNSVKKVFEHRNNFTYSVSIKTLAVDPNSPEPNPYVKILTIARDEDSLRKRGKYIEAEHNILDNTCFMDIFAKVSNMDKAYYFSNSLPKEKNYRNSSFKIHGEIPAHIEDLEEVRAAWTLPYKSELVVPIYPLDVPSKTNVQFIGYLCVDCNEEEAFNVSYDMTMVKGVADGIFDLMKQHKIAR